MFCVVYSSIRKFTIIMIIKIHNNGFDNLFTRLLPSSIVNEMNTPSEALVWILMVGIRFLK